MKLAANERITLLGILPATGDISTIKALRVLKEELGLDEEEVKTANMTLETLPDGRSVSRWSPERVEKIPEKEIETNGTISALIVGILQKLETDKKIEEKHISLWDKFCA